MLLLPDSFLHKVEVSVWLSSMGQIELFDHLQYLKPFKSLQMELLILDSNLWTHLTVYKQ